MDNLVTILKPKQKRGILFHVRLIGLALLLSYPPLYAASTVEQKIKVAYIYNFTKFIAWPEYSSDTFNICILGKDPFGLIFDSLESKTALGMPIKLLRLQKLTLSNHCHILFLGNSLEASAILPAPSPGILTVSENTQFVQNKGIIGFVIRNGKVKLQINNTHAKQAGLVISAKLLEIAELVEGGEDG